MGRSESSAAGPEAHAPVDLARIVFDMLNARDLDGVQHYWHDDVVEDFVAVRTFRGKAAARGFFEELFAAFPDFRLEVETLVGDDRVAFVAWRAAGTFRGGPFLGIAATGARVEQRGVDRMEFEGGKLLRNTIYYDGAGFARSVGMLPTMDSTAENAMKGAFNALTAVKKRLGL